MFNTVQLHKTKDGSLHNTSVAAERYAMDNACEVLDKAIQEAIKDYTVPRKAVLAIVEHLTSNTNYLQNALDWIDYGEDGDPHDWE